MQFTRIAANATATVCGREVDNRGMSNNVPLEVFFFFII